MLHKDADAARTNTPVRLGFVGVCGRGQALAKACAAIPEIDVAAACDIDAQGLPEAAQRLGAREQYVEYERMLDRARLDAVVLGTPMPLHARQAILALERGIHVLCEVTAAVSVAECRELVAAAQRSRGLFMMAENYTYMLPNVMVRTLARQGLFGTPYYAEGEYLHELKDLNERTPWRRQWHTGVDGITYGTHSLGPILQWFGDERVVSVCAAGSGRRHRDPRGDFYHQSSCVMLGKLSGGGLVKLRVDMVSDRPHATTNYQLQGTDGCYESARAVGEPNRIWLRSRCPDSHTWRELREFEDEFMPADWREAREIAGRVGHGGGDYFELVDFVNAIRGRKRCAIGIHEAMDMTLPGLISQQSIAEGGRWLDVPDSRDWERKYNLVLESSSSSSSKQQDGSRSRTRTKDEDECENTLANV